MVLRYNSCWLTLLTFIFCLTIKTTFGQSAGTDLIATYNSYREDLPKNREQLQNQLSPLLKNPSKRDQLKISYFILMGEGLKSVEPLNVNDVRSAFYSAEEIARLTGDNAVLLWTLNKIGYNLYRIRKLSEALPYFLEAKDLSKSVPEDIVLDKVNYYKQSGYFWSTVGNIEESIAYLQKAKEYAKNEPRQLSDILDNIGTFYLVKKDTTKAKAYFLEASGIASANNYTIRYAKTLGNLAIILESEGFIDSAINNLKRDIAISESLHEKQNEIFASILLANMYVRQNRVGDANSILLEIDDAVQSKENWVRFNQQVTNLHLDIAIKNRDLDRELFYRRRLDSLAKSADNWDSENVLHNSKWLAEKHNLKQEINDISQESITRTFVIVGTCLLIILLCVFFIYRKKREIEKRKEESIEEFDNDIFQQIFEQNRIINAAQNLIEKNATNHQNLEEDISYKQVYSPGSEFDNLVAEELHLYTDEKWLMFKKKFQQKYPDFYRQIASEYPEINDTYLRYIVLFKLGFNKYEVANILGVSLDAIKKNRQRLKKKLGDDRFNILFGELLPPFSS